MSFRNINREIVTNKQFADLDILLRRGKKSVTQFKKLKIRALSEEERKTLSNTKHIYKTGDKLYKLAHRYYGDTRYWYVLAAYNRKPTDFHCKLGDTIYIPFPLKEVLYLMSKDD